VAHENRIVPRDIQPENIMINTRGEIKIMDFGLAKITRSELQTRSGEIMGTLAYISPEQLSGKEVGQRTDIWSRGIMLYEVISGERPLIGQCEQAIIYSILNLTPKSIHPRHSDIPQKLLQIIQNILTKNPADRCENYKLLLNDLKQYIQKTRKENNQDI
jgi:serine/threonine protein kinase